MNTEARQAVSERMKVIGLPAGKPDTDTDEPVLVDSAQTVAES